MKSQPADQDDFEAVYLEHSGAIFRFALRLSGSREDAEDLTAETFCEAFQSWSRFRRESKPRTWLYRIAVNRWRMRRRKKAVKQVRLQCDGSFEAPGGYARVHDADELERALDLLSPVAREAFLLVKSEGLTHAEAAKVLGVPLGTVYSRVFGAVQTLREALEPCPKGIPCSEVTA